MGRNGTGKTNLLESVHVGTQGFSPRTRTEAQLIRFGEVASRVSLRGSRGGVPVEVEVTLRGREGKQALLNREPLRATEQLRSEIATLVFTPERLAIVKGPPAVRRAYFDRTLARLAPARATLSGEYGAALAQRNASLRRVAAGFSSPAALEPWTEAVATLGARVVAARHEAIALLDPPFHGCCAELGLEGAHLAYRGEPPTAAGLEARLARDLERGVTGLGPHLDDIALNAGSRDLRLFGSQGEQRLAVLSLLLAEAELLLARGTPALLLLDDVLSELDGERRRALAERIARAGQTLVTATSASALPLAPAQVVEVTPGDARKAPCPS